jgi:hypothetical protein
MKPRLLQIIQPGRVAMLARLDMGLQPIFQSNKESLFGAAASRA